MARRSSRQCPRWATAQDLPNRQAWEETEMNMTQRNLLQAGSAVAGATVLSRGAGAQSVSFTPNQRYPDPAVQVLDPSFTKYRIYSSTLEQLATGMRWAEDPVYFPEGGYLLCSDIFEGKRLNAPNDIVVKSDDTIWFTDPRCGIIGEWERDKAKPEQATANVY